MEHIHNKEKVKSFVGTKGPQNLEAVNTALMQAIEDSRDCLIHLKDTADNYLHSLSTTLGLSGRKAVILSDSFPQSYSNNAVILELEENILKEAEYLDKHPNVIVSRPGRVIDHMRRGNWKLYNPELFIICADPVSDQRYIQDLQFIQSKLNQSCNTIVLTSKEALFSDLHISVKISPKKKTSIDYIETDNVENFTRNIAQFIEDKQIKNLVCIGERPENISFPASVSFITDVETAPFFTQNILYLCLPGNKNMEHAISLFPEAQFFIVHTSNQKVNSLEESLTMSADKTNFEIDESIIKDFLESIVGKIKTEEDPVEMDQYRKLFKKYAPFFMRGYVGAYMLKYMPKKGFKSKPASRKPSNPNMVQLFVGLGKNRRIYPKDITGLFCSIEGISKPDIGDIKILENYSFVEIAKDKADQLIEALNGTEYRNRRMTVNYAKRKG